LSRHRVERAVGDQGYIDGWIVLGPEGEFVAERPTHPEAVEVAFRQARCAAILNAPAEVVAFANVLAASAYWTDTFDPTIMARTATPIEAVAELLGMTS